MKKFQGLAAAVGAAALILGLVGCNNSETPNYIPQESGLTELTPLAELDVLENPREYRGPSTAILPSVQVQQLVEAGEPQLPVTVVSKDRDGDREVTVTDSSRVIAISMTGNLAGLIYGLGMQDRLVGRDVSTNFPGTEDLPLVTRAGHSIEIESVLELEPTLVITDGSVGPLDVVLQLRDAGVPLVFVERDASFEGTYRVAEQIGVALGVPDAGKALAEVLREQVDTKIAEIATITPQDSEKRLRVAFLYIRGQANVYYLFGAESGIDTLLDAVGAIDVATEHDWVGMRPMTDEAIIEINPDLILLMTDGLSSVGGIDGLLTTLPALQMTTAGVNKRFVDMADTVVLSFGPRSAAVIDALARAFYAPESL